MNLRKTLLLTVFFFCSMQLSFLYALPEGAVVKEGSATFEYTPDNLTLSIRTESEKLIV